MTEPDSIILTDNLSLLTNITTEARLLLHSLVQTVEDVCLYVNANKTDFICFKDEGVISNLNGKPLKLEDQFTYLSSNISSTESDIYICLAKALRTINRLLITSKNKTIYSALHLPQYYCMVELYEL